MSDSLIQLAKNSLNYMDYHKCKDLPAKIVHFSSTLLAIIDEDDEHSFSTKTDIEFLVTSCMMSKSIETRLATYASFSHIVNDSLSLQIAIEINSKRFKKLKFLILNRVFYQLVAHGIFDPNESIKQHAENILVRLLQSELLVPPTFLKKLAQMIAIYMPLIQCLASQTTSLGQCILKMSDDSMTPLLNDTCFDTDQSNIKMLLESPIERLRSSLRYLFSVDKTLRKKGYQQTVGFFTKYHVNSSLLSEDTFIAQKG